MPFFLSDIGLDSSLPAMDSTTALIVGIISVVLCILILVAEWKIFKKAGQPGWKILIPIYNLYILVKIIDGNGWKFLLFLIPIVDIIYGLMLIFRGAKAFGKGIGFGFGLLLLPEIFVLILGFGSAKYVGPQGPKK